MAPLIGQAKGATPPSDSPGQRSERPGEPVTLLDVAQTFADVAAATGAGVRRARDERLARLAGRASADERDFLNRIVFGEMRTGVSDGLVLEAIAAAWSVDVAAARRAALFLGDLSAVAVLAATGGTAAVAGASPRPFVALLPMLGEIADDFGTVLAAHGGTTALEYKYDGARIQLHRAGDRVQVWTRRLSDVTRSLPDVVEVARRDLCGEPFILDGEVVALDAAGRPLPFQELMRRFRRVHGVEALVREMPLALHFFDCLMADGRSLIDEPYARRWEALARVTGGRYLAERRLVRDEAAALVFRDAALAAGHEGVMAKDPASTYEPGGRGKRWFKWKAAETVDCVIVAVDRGSGRRQGWLSNYHLAVRDGDGFAEVGKTFKGFTDAQFVEMTERLWTLATADDGYTVRVRPEVVVEVEYNEIQKSPTYASEMALRFARIARVRDDKAPGQATTLAELRHLYERQFQTKGRAGVESNE
ncbi:MAG TPA: ATP-dependent DNA ligase [Methylomirabilota bacterium]|nr:ATP-dependent DNA ligase [Methylomirabilota bacterium]